MEKEILGNFENVRGSKKMGKEIQENFENVRGSEKMTMAVISRGEDGGML